MMRFAYREAPESVIPMIPKKMGDRPMPLAGLATHGALRFLLAPFQHIHRFNGSYV